MENQVFECVVTGNGLSAVSLLLNPDIPKSTIRMSWRPSQTSMDANPDSLQYIFAPISRLHSEYKGPQIKISSEEIHFYYSQFQRIKLSDVLIREDSLFPMALKKKILALGLFNDPTPSVWSPSKQQPHFDWIAQDPKSFEGSSKPQGSEFVLIPKHELLKYLGKISQDSEPDIDKNVLELKIDSSSRSCVLSYAPPLKAESFSFVLCTDFFQLSQTQTSNKVESPCYWQSYSVSLPRSIIAALPKVSLWTDQHSNDFLRTGLLTDQCLKRVFVVDKESSQEALLQVQIFRSENSAIEKPFSFLNALCPRLKDRELKIIQSVLEDDIIFNDFSSQEIRAAKQLSYWHQVHSSQTPQSFEKLLKKFKIKTRN